MVSEKRPRRSQPEKEPLTIDLEAERTVTEEAEAIASQEPVTDEPAEISATAVPDTTDTVASDAEIDGVKPNTADKDGGEEAEREDERADAAAAAFDEEPPHLANSTPEPMARKATSAGALAAGILGRSHRTSRRRRAAICRLRPGTRAGSRQWIGRTESDQRNRGDQGRASIAPGRPRRRGRYRSLEGRLAALEQAAQAPAGANAPDVTALQAEVANLTKEIAALKTDLADARSRRIPPRPSLPAASTRRSRSSMSRSTTSKWPRPSPSPR